MDYVEEAYQIAVNWEPVSGGDSQRSHVGSMDDSGEGGYSVSGVEAEAGAAAAIRRAMLSPCGLAAFVETCLLSDKGS